MGNSQQTCIQDFQTKLKLLGLTKVVCGKRQFQLGDNVKIAAFVLVGLAFVKTQKNARQPYATGMHCICHALFECRPDSKLAGLGMLKHCVKMPTGTR